MRPYVEEYRRVRALVRAVGPNPHRWTLDPHVRKGTRVADLFLAAMAVVGLVLSRLGTPLGFYVAFPTAVVALAFALLLVVSAQSRDEERILAKRKGRR